MTRLMGWLIYRLGVQTLLSLTLLMVALGSVALGLVDVIQGLDAGLLLPVATMGLVVGWGLGKSPLPAWVAGLVASGVGAEAIVFRVGRLGGALVALLRELANGVVVIAQALLWGVWRAGSSGNTPRMGYEAGTGWLLDARPVLLALGELWTGTSTLLIRLRDWSLALVTGQPSFDPVAAALVWSLVLWGVAAWAGWFVRRPHQPLQGVAPAGVLLSGSLFYVRGNPIFLLPLLGATLLLVVLIGQEVRERRWTVTGIDFPVDVGQEVAFGGAALSLILVTAALLMPSISVRQIAERVGRLIGGEASGAQPVAGSLGLDPRVSRPATVLDQDRLRAPGLPRRHLLGSGPELSDQVVLVVYPDWGGGTDDELTPVPVGAAAAESVPRYYWRSLTYDRYTGRGWITGQTEMVEYQAGALSIFRDRFEPAEVESQLIPATWHTRRKIQTEIRAVKNLGGLLYAAGDLVTADQDYRVAWRSLEDAFGATFVSAPYAAGAGQDAAGVGPIFYRADSLVPAVGEVQLRTAGSDYPAWVRERYLALPEQVPARVLALGRDLTATVPTPYDRARAIEAYLRTIPYSLDLPLPPLDRDVVDYFLFDLRQGYCDYYASAMVVLARAAGLPARLAVGYFSGTYDAANSRYVVTEADAHAWVEVFFPGYGWIEFEPTAGRAPLERPADAGPIVPPELEVPLEPVTARRAGPGRFWWLGLGGGLGLLGLGGTAWLVADGWRLRRLPPEAVVTVLYRRLYHHARRLGVPVLVGNTPYEFAASFAERVADLAQVRRWGGTLTPAVYELRWLADLYVQACYSPHPLDASTGAQVVRTWGRLRRRLWLVWAWPK